MEIGVAPRSQSRPLTGVERFFREDEVIVSKTDLTGRITYANRVFTRMAGSSEQELLRAPHNILRHPDMPRCIFKLLWDKIQSGREIFAYVINRSLVGDHYWVFAHVTPSFDDTGSIVGYHSNRRVPDRTILEQKIIPLYRSLIEIEQRYEDRKQGQDAAFAAVLKTLQEQGMDYDEWVFSL